ncbi:MAG TPA: N-acetyltransferase, partial [Candidatus Binatia bacterium]|nr:N-acetyltransferase [Candidatus Binatia bacterium]
FETRAEADLVDALREQARPVVSLVAEAADRVVGHIMFSPVSLAGHPNLKIMGLAPLAVTPCYQRQGIGSALVHAGLDRCRQLGVGSIVVLGHPEYYPRFGFSTASQFGLTCAYNVPDEAFMVLELQPGYLANTSGLIQYHVAFSNVEAEQRSSARVEQE